MARGNKSGNTNTATAPGPSISAEPPAVSQTSATEPATADLRPAVEEAPAASRGRQGEQNRPTCPYCSQAKSAVICVAKRSDPFFTRYYCPTAHCSFAIKVARPKARPRVEQDEFAAR